MVCSPARLLANQQNAKRSTGPKTPEGKAISRRNSLKHGLTGAGIVLPSEDEAAAEGRFAEFEADLKPKNGVARYLVGRTAMLSVRLDRCARQESAMLAGRVLRAEDDHDELRFAEAEALMAGLAATPAANARKLRRSPEGVDLMIRKWLGTREDLGRRAALVYPQVHKEWAENLQGRTVAELPISRTYVLFEAICGNFRLLGDEAADLDDPSRRAWARAQLVEWIDEEVARLRAHRETFDLDALAIDRARSVDRVLFDASKEATLARKYEAAAVREFFRTLLELEEVQAGAEDTADTGAAMGSSFPEAPAEPDPAEEAEVPAGIVHPRRPMPAQIAQYLEEMEETEAMDRELMALEEAQAGFA